MDYLKMTKQELIQEIMDLRTKLDLTENTKLLERIQYRINLEDSLAKAFKILIATEDVEVNEIFKIIGQAIAVNRVFVYRFQDDVRHINKSLVWSDDYTSLEFKMLPNLDTASFPWGLRQLQQGNNIVINDTSDFPIEAWAEKEFLVSQGIRAALLGPIMGYDHKLVACIGFHDTEKCRVWKNEDLKCLELLSEMLVSYWDRKKMEEELRLTHDELENRVIERTAELVSVNEKLRQEITERQQIEQELQRSEANFRKLAETSPALILVYNAESFLYVNSTCETMLGYSCEELLKMSFWEPIHPDYRELARENYFARHNGIKVPPYEVLIHGKNGQEIWGYLYADIIDYEGQTATLAMIIDISERKKLEEDLLQSSKLESLGILAGGIAHDFNNILTVISGNVSLAKMIMNVDNEVTEILTEVEQAALQARDLTQQLLTFSKGGAPIKETASIKDLLHETASFVLRGSNVNCNYSIAADLWPVNIDKGQISQVINNLIINADQAMPEGGTIKLSAINIGSDSKLPSSLKPADYIKITIKDQGIGIVKKHLDKIFDPYFTTKQKGHGLGLATCYSIIKKHDGDINISSKIGFGTIANVYLPAFPDQIIELMNPPQLAMHGQGKILVMDDEAEVRKTLGKMLQCLGYTISTAADGLKAIHLYQKAQQINEPYDVVLMDLTIAGGMGGKEAVKMLLEIDPKAKVVVSSGYSNDPVMANYKKYGFCGVLPKPYEIQAVNQILYELIMKQEAV